MRSPRLSPHTLGVLEELLASPAKWRYGYDLMKATRIAAGTMYPILIRLDGLGWLESKWVPPVEEGRPPRRQYRLTAAGKLGARHMQTRAGLAGSPARSRA
jgi:PadR family transcriptional regulator, regulatory protein PadR